MTRALWTLVAFIVVVGCGVAQPGRSGSRSLTPLQVARMQQVTDVMISPDGARVAFTRREPHTGEKAPGSARSSLWLLDAAGGEARQVLGRTASVRGVSWSPDGTRLCFLGRDAARGKTEVFALPLAGGEPVRVTRTETGVSSYRWSPDGSAIAFTAMEPRTDARKKARSLGFDHVVVDEDARGISLWLWDVRLKKARRLTREGAVFAFEWSDDSARLALGIAPTSLVDDRYMRMRLHQFDLQSGTLKPLVDNPGKLGAFAWSPDGGRLAYVSAANPRDPHAGMLYVLDAQAGKVRSLTEGYAGMVHEVEWESGDALLVTASEGVRTFVHRVDARTGAREAVLSSEGTTFRRVAHHAGSGRRFLVASNATHPAELFRVDEGKLTRLTDSNPWLADVRLGRQTVETIKARDGLGIEGMLMWPVGYSAATRYPLVIVAHGGPESHFSNGWLTGYSQWGQVLAGRGYFVWYPNYRASTGRGVDFAMADHGDPMGAEFEDHLDAIATFDARKLIDPARVGIGGGSYGGYTAAWAATRHSQHFACAVSFVPFVDIRTKWYTSDIPYEFYMVHYEEKWPHQQVAFLAERSPLSYADNCKTPLLLLGGDRDTRVHPSQPFMLYRAVKTATRTPVRYVQYPGEGHGNRRNTSRHDYMLRTLRWFEHYLVPGNQRAKAPPPIDLDYGAWKS